MAEISGDGIDEGRLDLVPMIDCIMLLLLFFMMTTKFTPEEKVIANILPTNKGMSASKPQKVDPPAQLNVLIYPDGPDFVRGRTEREYDNAFIALAKNAPRAVNSPSPVIQKARIRINNRPNEFVINVSVLTKTPGPELKQHVEDIQNFIKSEMAVFEKTGADRKGQDPVVIQCFSSLSWQFALVAYDAVRNYEMGVGAARPPWTPESLAKMREVNFSPPRVRNYSNKELGAELFEIIHSK